MSFDLEINKFINNIKNYNSKIEDVDINQISSIYKFDYANELKHVTYNHKKKYKPWSKVTLGNKIEIIEKFCKTICYSNEAHEDHKAHEDHETHEDHKANETHEDHKANEAHEAHEDHEEDEYNKLYYLLIDAIYNSKISKTQCVEYNSSTNTLTHIYKLYKENDEYKISDNILSKDKSIGIPIKVIKL